MFKEKCQRCSRPVDRKFSFCPYCGSNLEIEREAEDFGFLGKEDKKEDAGFGFSLNINDIFQNMNSIVKDLTKNFEKEIKPENEKVFSKAISINLCPGKPPQVRVSSNGKPVSMNIQPKKANEIKMPKLPKEKLDKISKLPKEEPKTEVRRFGNKILYSFEVPGAKSNEDVMINNLEAGVEIIVFGKEKVYVKNLPLKLELSGYNIEDGVLEIEFRA